MQELERIQSHLLWYGVLAHDTGFDTAFHLVWRDREIVSDILEMISGNRVNYAMHTIGGVRRDISKELADKIRPLMAKSRKLVEYHRDFMLTEKTFLVRQKGVAVLSKEDAKRFCAVGPTARASGLKIDVRYDDPYSAYGEFRDQFNVITYDTNDVFSRVVVRLIETVEACNYIKWMV